MSLLLISAAGIPVAAAAPGAHDPAQIVIRVLTTGLRNDRGQLLICLTSKPAAFPDCSKDPDATRRAVRVGSIDRAQGIVLYAPRAGTYAVAVVHDENTNGRLDTALMVPREGFGFSRDAAVRMGPPRFRDAAFDVRVEGTTQTLRMRYML